MGCFDIPSKFFFLVYIAKIECLFRADLGRNHVNETARHGIFDYRLWEENLGNVTEVFVNDFFGFVAGDFVAQTLSQKRK